MSAEAKKLLDTVTSAGVKIADGAVEELFEEGHDLLDQETDGELAKAGHDALELIEANKEPFLRLTQVGFAKVVGHFGSGDEEAAMNEYMAQKATYQERRRWMQEGGDLAMKAAESAETNWSAVLDVLKQVGELGLKFLIKIAMTALVAV